MNPPLDNLAGLGGSPVFITGSPKVGKSVLLEVFRRLKEFHVEDEPMSTWQVGAHRREDDCRGAEEATDAEVARVRAEILRTLQSTGKSRYADVLSHHALQLPYLRAIFPNGRVIVVTRHPRELIPEAVYFWKLKPSVRRTLRNRWRGIKIASVPALARRFLLNIVSSHRQGRLNTWGAVVPGQKDFASTHSIPELAAYQWATFYDVVLEAAENWSSSVYFVTFEDLRNRPRETVEAMLYFCQTALTPQLLDFAADFFDPTFVMRKRVELSESDWQSVWPLVHHTAQKLGYETPI